MTKFWLKIPRLYDLIQILATGGFLKKVTRALPEIKYKRIFDMGCGTGNLIKHTNPMEYTGWDVNGEFIKLAKKKYGENRYKFCKKDIINDPFPAKNVDYAIIINVLHHLTDKEVVKVFNKVKGWKKAPVFIIVESRPLGLIGWILERLDAGSNFRKFSKINNMINEKFLIKNETIVRAPFGTYEYLVATIDL